MDCYSKREKLVNIIIYSVIALFVVGFLFCAYAFNWIDGRVTFVVNGETYKESTAIRTKNILLPADPTVEGYDFVGWYYDDGTFENKFELSDLHSVYFFGREKVYAKFVKQHVHEYVSTVIKEATCAEPGSKGDVCTQDGCDSVINLQTIATLAHSVTNGTLTKNISGDTVRFDFDCSCSECGKQLGKKNVKVTEKIHSVQTCLVDGKYEYTYKDAETGVSCSYIDIVEKHPHTLNDEFVTKVTEAYDGFVPYGTDNVILDENVEIVCGEPASAHFICEACERYVPVNVKKFHIETSSVLIAPTCTEKGVSKITCSNPECLKEIGNEDIPPLGHDSDFILTKNGNKFTVTTDCTRVGCDLCIVENIDATSVSSRITKAATCFSVGEKLYTYMYKGEFEVSCTEPIAKTAHKSQGNVIDSAYFVHYDADGNGYVGDSFPGLYYFADQDPRCEDEDIRGYYFCDDCNSAKTNPIYVRVYINHDYDMETVKPATCVESGLASGVCKYCGDEKTETISIEDHDYVWTLVIDNPDGVCGVDDIVEAVGECKNCGIDAVVAIDPATDTVSYEYKLPVKCTDRATHIYTFEKTNTSYGDINAVKNVATSVFGTHSLNGKLISELAGTDGVAENNPAISGIVTQTSLKLSIDGVYLFASDVDPVCYEISGQLVSGWYVCDECNTIREHAVYVDYCVPDYSWVVVTLPTCGEEGLKRGKCNCGETVYKSIPATGDHSMEYSLCESASNGGPADSLDICKICTKCDTQFSIVRTIKKSNAKKEVISVGDCCEDGITKYTYTYSGHKLVLEVNVHGPHFLNGVNIDVLKDADGNIPSNIEGISLPTDYIAGADGDKVVGGFVCSKCGEFIKSSVIIVNDDSDDQ